MPGGENMSNTRSGAAVGVQLSLKNIYRLLSMQDYPLPTPSVFPPNTWRGVTVVSFWRDLFHAAFPAEIPLDLFDTDDKRSRALSVLLNGTGGAGFRKKLFTTLSANLSPNLLLKLTTTWMTFLRDEQYNAPVLSQRLHFFAIQLQKGISAENACAMHLKTIVEEFHSNEQQSAVLPLFQHALQLAWLTLFSLYISRWDDPALVALRMDGAASLSALFNRYATHSRGRKLLDITNRNCVLCIPPVQPEFYVGHYALLNEANERLWKYGKLLISGIGGIGKSEFARQLLRQLSESGHYERAAYVQYQDSLADSFRKAFPKLASTNDNAVIEECRQLLEERGGRTLLLIDNMNQTTSEDAALAQLCAYGCDVVLTSRLVALDGFDVLVLPALSLEDSQALFRIHMPHSQADQDKALAQLCESVQGHPLSLVLFAGLCRSKYWSVAELYDKLQANGFNGLSFVRNGVRATISETFSAAFDCAALEAGERKLLRLIAMLPYIFYLPTALFQLAADVTKDVDELCDYLQLLADRSWLTQSAQGYLMHPVIAETLRLLPASCDDYPLLWKHWNRPNNDTGLDQTVRVEQPMILEALRHSSPLNEDGFEVLIKAEQAMISGSFSPVGHLLLEKHREYLDSHPHADNDEVLYCINHAFFAVLDDNLEKFRQQIEKLASLPLHDMEQWPFYPSLCNVIEFACGLVDKPFLNQIYEAIHPTDENSANMVCYLNSLCCKHRLSDKDLPQAVQTAQNSLDLIEKLGLEQSIHAAGCYTRYAYCLADQGKRAQAAPYLKQALEVMSHHGYLDTSPTMMQTRNAYALMLVDAGDKRRAMKEYKVLQKLYQKQYQTESSGYSQLCSNMSQLFAKLGQYDEAEAHSQEAIAIDEKINNTKGLTGCHIRTLADHLLKREKYQEAMAQLNRAYPLLEEGFGKASFQVAYCNVLIAQIHFASGEDDSPRLDEALGILRQTVGEEHPFTQRAKSIRRC